MDIVVIGVSPLSKSCYLVTTNSSEDYWSSSFDWKDPVSIIAMAEFSSLAANSCFFFTSA